MRGEYHEHGFYFDCAPELPPRARRILTGGGLVVLGFGTTSACAENTLTSHIAIQKHGNYLRVRGEYDTARHGSHAVLELPPRARRILNTIPAA